MKKLLILTISAFLLAGCQQSKEEKMQALIEAKLQQTMKDWSSYEFVNMSQVDSAFTSFKFSEECKKQRMKILAAMNRTSDMKKKLANCKKSEESLLKDSVTYLSKVEDELSKELKEMEREYKGDFIGFKADLTFRGNNSFGGKVLNKVRVMTNKEISEIVEMKNID